MNKFALFNKSNKFYWSPNIIIYSIILLCFSIIFIKEKILNLEKNSFDIFLFSTIIIVFLCGLVLKFICFTKIETLRGNLEGYLSFEKEFIKINDEIHTLEKINNIQISNDDYSGKTVNTSKGDFGPALSNGTNNFIVIFLKTGKVKKHQFEMINSNDFQNIRILLIEYHIKKKIDFWELAKILGEKSTEEIANLTKEIETIRTTENTNTINSNNFI